jgi:hypothetical protein
MDRNPRSRLRHIGIAYPLGHIASIEPHDTGVGSLEDGEAERHGGEVMATTRVGDEVL